MKEIRKNQKIVLNTRTGLTIEGEVFDYEKDRVFVQIYPEFVELCRDLKELEEFIVDVHTILGVISMKSDLISGLDENRCITIENEEKIVDDFFIKRQFVRINCNIPFVILKFFHSENATCINISGGGIAFTTNAKLKLDEMIKVQFLSLFFEKTLRLDAQIVKVLPDKYIAKFIKIKPSDLAAITKYVFRKISEK